MSLFVGNISKSVSQSELEKMFNEYGSVRLNYKGSYAFAEFDHEKDAEEAIDNLQSKDVGGRKINIEWSKKSRRFDESKSRRKRSPSSRSRNDGRCYNCGRKGHYLRDCKSRRRHSPSSSRSRSRRRRRSSSRDRKHRHRSRRSHSRSSRSKSHSYRKRGRKSSSKSSSSSRSRRRSESSRGRSPYERKRRDRSEEKKDRTNHKNEEKNNTNKRESRSSSSRRSDRSPNEKKIIKSSDNSSQSNINQILDKDMIVDKYRNENNIKIENNPVDNNGFKKQEIKENRNNSATNGNLDYTKYKIDEIKSELNKKGIPFEKYAKKSELFDLLSKAS